MGDVFLFYCSYFLFYDFILRDVSGERRVDWWPKLGLA